MELSVIGGGLAGSEAAWQAARLGVRVRLFEMRPELQTPAHVGDQLAELVCSNSLGSVDPYKAPGLLKAELRGLGSLILECAAATSLPAGHSLAVDRVVFAEAVTAKISSHPLIELVREEVTEIPDGTTILATGPLTSDRLAEQIQKLSGSDHLHFYDAISPIVSMESIDMEVAFRGSRYDKDSGGDGDYINCPMSKEQYKSFLAALTRAEQIELRGFEQEDADFFEGCLPVEVMAGRNEESLRFGPMRPVGLTNPRGGERPYAVVQLRQDDLAGGLFNIVGFQTNLKWGEQKRVLRMIPGLEKADFLRYGMMHRNTYIDSPKLLQPTLQFRGRADLFFAGQIIGVEGYMGNAATGLVAGLNAARLLKAEMPVIFPPQTMLGALTHYVTHADPGSFQPMKANFGLFPLPQSKMAKPLRYPYYSQRALTRMRRFTRSNGINYSVKLAERDIESK